MDRRRMKLMVRGALLAAIVAAMTMLIKLPVPATGGYVHPGDGAIFLSAYLLGPGAAVPAALGSALADILGGYAVYALPTALIKGAMGWIAGRLIMDRKTARNIMVLMLCELIMVSGYFAFEWMMYGAGAAISAVIPNLIQGAAGVVLGVFMMGAGRALKGNI